MFSYLMTETDENTVLIYIVLRASNKKQALKLFERRFGLVAKGNSLEIKRLVLKERT